MPRNENKKRCKATNRTGERCKRWAKPGWNVCHSHGANGGAPPEKLNKNDNARTHGLFSKFLPKETLEIVGQINEMTPVDMLWMNIKMQFASIMRAQQIMYVEDKDDLTKELKKHKEATETEEKEYELQFAWDKQANFLNAQSRAMGELRSMLKQFVELVNHDDQRKLEAERMQTVINKTKAETERIKAEAKNEEDGTSQVLILNDKEAMRNEMMKRDSNND